MAEVNNFTDHFSACDFIREKNSKNMVGGMVVTSE